jgi:indoleamine 2,3-dioxygenase
MHFDNLEVIRSFSGHSSEAGFILVHCTMVSNTPNLVKATLQSLDSARNHDRTGFNEGLRNYQKTMRSINVEMETMWSRSLPEDYAKFRVLIMGIKNQPMFPNGVFYEGRDPETNEVKRLGPFQFRGESGANDNIIPTGDNLLQLTDRMPSNPLTEILQDFRTYRPVQHNTWLTYVKDYASLVNFREYAESDQYSLLLYLSILDEIRDFRNRHWNFTKEYIIKRSSHPVATGGSPIIEWLPNQLGAILTFMEGSIEKIDVNKLPDEEAKQTFHRIKQKISAQSSHLRREVEKLKEEREKPKH